MLEPDLRKLADEAADVGVELHRVSHELHPARLQQLGLEQSVRSFCEELTAARKIAIDVQIEVASVQFAPEVALCLYRVAQEALQNVVKHSGAGKAVLRLIIDDREVVLRVAGDGVGFDPSAVRQKATLGLISMRERTRLVNGRFLVSSDGSSGTIVDVRCRSGRRRRPEGRHYIR